MDNCKIIMLGTGSALTTQCYNTCFILQSPEAMLMVDAGGGNGILAQLKKALIKPTALHDLFVTHAHTDHILGAVWMVRTVIHRKKNGEHDGAFRIYGHHKVLDVLYGICRMTLSEKDMACVEDSILFCEIKDGNAFRVGDMEIRCFDIQSTKEKQFGFRAILPDGQTVVCLGDEPYNEKNRHEAEHADWLLCEAFCLYADSDIFKPHEKHHGTALEAGMAAQSLHARNLLLYHTEDQTLSTRKQCYTAEAAQNFNGNIFVPDDLEVVELNR